MTDKDPKLVVHVSAEEKAAFVARAKKFHMSITSALRAAINLWNKDPRGGVR